MGEKRQGRKPYFSHSDELKLLVLAQEHPGLTLAQLAQAFVREHAPERHVANEMTVKRALVRCGHVHRRRAPTPKPKTPQMPTQPDVRDETRYAQKHRTSDEEGYPSDLSDAQWALVEALVQRPGTRGPKPKDPRRTLNALMYIARTGCQWRYLPKSFGKWNTIAQTLYRWREMGLIERIYEQLHQAERVRVGKSDTPSLCILDSQSIKTTEKGGIVDMMQERRSREESAICSSIH